MGETPTKTFNSEAVDWSDIGYQVFTGLLKAFAQGKVRDGIISTISESEAVIKADAWNILVDIFSIVGKVFAELDEAGAPLAGALVGPVLRGLFAGGLSDEQFTRRLQAGGGAGAGATIVDGFLAAVKASGAPGGGPSDQGARALAAAAVSATLESSVNAAIPELISDLLPADFGKFTALSDIPDQIIHTLGLSRLVRQALRPLVNATCTTPATWYYNKQYQQHLLSAAEVAREIARDKMTRDAALEELSRDGYSPDRIDAIINAALKFMGAADLYWLVRAHEWDIGNARQHLQDSGYDAGTAALLIEIEQIKIINAFEDQLATAAVDAYAAGRISDSALDGYVRGSTFTDQHIAQLKELAIGKKALAAKPLTAAEAEACVLAGVLAYSDYRDALRLENRTDDAITSLELLLRAKADAKTSIAEHKVQQAADAAKAKADKAAAAQAKKDAHEKAVAQAQLGKPADIEQAYIRGIVPIDRVTEVLAPLYDADTVATLESTLQEKRTAFVAQQKARDAAAARGTDRGINVGQLETAVAQGVLGLQEFHDRLLGLKFDAADADVITSTLDAKLKAAATAKQLHDAAAAKAKTKHVNLAALEWLVRKGHRSIADFAAFVASLGYDQTSVAILVDKLQQQIADDAAAAKVKADAAAKAADKGLSLSEAERATVLGVQTIDWFNTWLIHAGIDPQAQQTILATVKDERDQAQAAQQRRAAADARRDASRVPVADLARAARLTVIPVAVYTAALTARGYSADDVALETDLLVQEISNSAAAQQKHAAAAGVAKDKHVSLSTLDAALKDGRLSRDAYTQRVIALGFSPDDAALIAGVVSDQAALAAAAATKRSQIIADAATKHISLAQLETAILDGLAPISDYEQQLTDLKYAPEDVALLVGILQQRADKLTAARARAAQLATGDPGKETGRAAYEKSVTDGLRTIDQYAQYLSEQGYGPDDAQVYVDLEQFTLDKAAAKAGG